MHFYFLYFMFSKNNFHFLFTFLEYIFRIFRFLKKISFSIVFLL